MPSLLQSDYFVIGIISLFALMVNRHEIASAVVYAAFCWIALLASYKIPTPEFILLLSADIEMANNGWQLLMASFSSLLVIALIYAIRQCMDGILPKMIIYLCWMEILLHITCYGLLLNGMHWMTYNWLVLANQALVILLFIARGGYGRTILRSRLFRDSAHSY
jgi:hypothetical protein